MSLPPGTRVGVYQIQSQLGEGGMGQVYRARDTRLGRDVALKVLPDAFAADPDRLARFTREAQMLASLNHQNIAAIFGIEAQSIVMELVEGDDLSAVIARGPMPLADVAPIARQIADALEAAHEQGVVHRDLKPANIKVRPDGTVKVLDFGLAKALAPDGASGSAEAMNSPTLTNRATQIGTIIGTAAYMSPEQARGKAVDRRADIWAFGAVLFEMLTGRRAFEGDDISITLANVLKEDVKFDALPSGLPPSVMRLLRRCLEKDPRKRLSAIGDARLELDEREPDPARSVTAASGRPTVFARLWPALAGVLVTAAVAGLLWHGSRKNDAEGVLRMSLLPPGNTELYPDSSEVAVSPDGTMVAFIVGSVTAGEGSELWVRSLDSTTARRLDDAQGAQLPFWSPDSRRIGFTTTSKLKTIPVTGGRADVVCDARNARGATWNASNVIVFAQNSSGPLFKVPASGGGTPEPVTTLDPQTKETSHRFPTFLPDGDHFLYVTLPARNGKFDLYVGAVSGGPRTHVGSVETAPVYADPGWLLYGRQGGLAAQPFDADALKFTGDPVSLPDEPVSVLDPSKSWTSSNAVSVSRTGVLAYFSSPSINSTVSWSDVTGKIGDALTLPPAHYERVAISPDGARAVLVRSVSASESTLWLVDLARGGGAPLINGHGRNDSPVWSPDGKQIAFANDRDGPQHIYVKTIDDAAPEHRIDSSDAMFQAPSDWSPDGASVVVVRLDPETAHDIWIQPATGGAMKRVVAGPLRDLNGRLSPDGKRLAFHSEDSGRFELYFQSFPAPDRRIPVSTQGSVVSWWTRDSRQLLFVGADLRTIWRANLDAGSAAEPSAAQQLGAFPPGTIGMDAMPDRQRFLVITPERSGIGSATVVLHWQAELDKLR